MSDPRECDQCGEIEPLRKCCDCGDECCSDCLGSREDYCYFCLDSREDEAAEDECDEDEPDDTDTWEDSDDGE